MNTRGHIMTGAIIGDLATGTAELSTYGLTLLGLYKIGMGPSDLQQSKTELAHFMARHSSGAYAVPIFLSGVILTSWKVCSHQDLLRKLPSKLKNDKECFYIRYLIPVISNLLQGKSKKEAICDQENDLIIEKLIGWYHDRTPVRWDLMMTYVSFAWDCFERSRDFTSALHNAMQCPADKHLAGFLTGAIAEAMYGCRQYPLKINVPELDNIVSDMRKYEEEETWKR